LSGLEMCEAKVRLQILPIGEGIGQPRQG